MHRIIKAHLGSFAVSHGLQSYEESRQFEFFANFSIIKNKTNFDFDLDDVTTTGSDDGLDGVVILIDEEIVLSKEDAEAIFRKGRKNHDVEIIFIQSKSGENFDLGEFLKFKESILRLISSDDYDVDDDVQVSAWETLSKIFENVPKLRDGKPSLSAYFVTTGIYRSPQALESAKQAAISAIADHGLFNKIEFKFIDREDLTKLWVNTYSGIDTSIEMFGIAALPQITGIEEAYLGVVRAKDFVHKLLLAEDGGIRSQVFEENVRSFLGIENPVNASISQTLQDTDNASRFPVLNNGITIVSPDVVVQGTTLHLRNYQIVNGCQTSHVLWENYRNLDSNTMVNVKVIETNNEDIFAELVRATNSQSKIEDTQFYSLRPIIKRVEKYFDSFEDGDGRLYFERRDRQFVGREIPATRIFNLHNAAKCVTSMFCHRPDLAFKYPKQMYESLGEQIFSDEIKESIFHSACLTLYRIHLLASNGTIPQNIKKYKWHMLPLVKAVICGDTKMHPISSNKAAKQADKIISKLTHHGRESTSAIQAAVRIVTSIEGLTNDRLKRQAIMQELLAEV